MMLAVTTAATAYAGDVGTARKEMRQSDVLARFGGEEFIALLPETHIQDAMIIAERIRQRIQQEYLYPAGSALPLYGCQLALQS